jgi:hypothetical protein
MAQEEGIGLTFRMYRRVGMFPSLLGFNHTYRNRKRELAFLGKRFVVEVYR